ncbi:MBL fold metallo-hydrolase [Candidatus Latescibacterota bacterium]
MSEALAQLLSMERGIGICWLGNLGWLLRAQGLLLAFDLDLDCNPRISPPPVSAHELAPVLDLQLITHEHGDHFCGSTSRILAENGQCRFILPASCLDKARDLGLSEDRTTVARPGQPFDILGIQVEPQRALHGHVGPSVYRHANLDDCGYVLNLSGLRIYQPGDTVLLQEHLEDFADVDILFVSPTEHNTRVDGSVRLIEAIRPTHIFPQHFATYVPTAENSFWTVGYPSELGEALPEELRAGYHQVEQGEVFVVPESPQ